mgnify:CR=1 FL=1
MTTWILSKTSVLDSDLQVSRQLGMVRSLLRVNKPLYDMSKGAIQKYNVSRGLVPSSLSVRASTFSSADSSRQEDARIR